MISYEKSKTILKKAKIKIKEEIIKSINSINKEVPTNVNSNIIYQEGKILDSFELYSGLDGLYSMFANEAILLIFWLHFLAISLFAGSWIVRDCKKYFIPKVIAIPSLILTYFTGPIGLVIYWFFRIFFAKKISFND